MHATIACFPWSVLRNCHGHRAAQHAIISIDETSCICSSIKHRLRPHMIDHAFGSSLRTLIISQDLNKILRMASGGGCYGKRNGPIDHNRRGAGDSRKRAGLRIRRQGLEWNRVDETESAAEGGCRGDLIMLARARAAVGIDHLKEVRFCSE